MLTKGNGAVGRAETGRSIIARNAGAEIGGRARTVAARRHVKQHIGVAVGILACRDTAAIDPVQRRDDWRGDARSPIDRPTRAGAAEGAVDRNTGVRIGDRRDICHGAPGTARIRLPAWLADIGTAAAARATPCRFRPTAHGRIAREARAANGDHACIGCRHLNTIAAVAGRCCHCHARNVVLGRKIAELRRAFGTAIAV